MDVILSEMIQSSIVQTVPEILSALLLFGGAPQRFLPAPELKHGWCGGARVEARVRAGSRACRDRGWWTARTLFIYQGDDSAFRAIRQAAAGKPSPKRKA